MSQHYVGLDVSLDQTSLCIIDASGRIVRETKLDTDSDVITEYLAQAALAVERIGLEEGLNRAGFRGGDLG